MYFGTLCFSYNAVVEGSRLTKTRKTLRIEILILIDLSLKFDKRNYTLFGKNERTKEKNQKRLL